MNERERGRVGKAMAAAASRQHAGLQRWWWWWTSGWLSAQKATPLPMGAGQAFSLPECRCKSSFYQL